MNGRNITNGYGKYDSYIDLVVSNTMSNYHMTIFQLLDYLAWPYQSRNIVQANRTKEELDSLAMQ